MEPSEVLSRLRAEFPGLEWKYGYRLGSSALIAAVSCPIGEGFSIAIAFHLDGKFTPQWRTDDSDYGLTGNIGTLDDAIAQLKTWIRDYANELLKAIGEESPPTQITITGGQELTSKDFE